MLLNIYYFFCAAVSPVLRLNESYLGTNQPDDEAGFTLLLCLFFLLN